MPAKRAARIPSAKQVAAAEKKKTEKFEKRDTKRLTGNAMFHTRALEAWDTFADSLPELAGVLGPKRAVLEVRLGNAKKLDAESVARHETLVQSMDTKEYRAHHDRLLRDLPVPIPGGRYAIDWAAEDRINNACHKQVQLLNFECIQACDLAVLLQRKAFGDPDVLMVGGEAFLCCPNSKEFMASVVMLDVCDKCPAAEFDNCAKKFLQCGRCGS